LALRELHASYIDEKTKAIGESPHCQCSGDRRMSLAPGAIRAPKLVQNGEMKMKYLMTLALIAAFSAPAAVAAQPVTTITMNCGTGTAIAGAEIPNLHGNWDFLIDAGGTPNFGLLSIGQVDGGYGGSLTPVTTAPVVLRRVTLTGNNIHMVVASRDGDVLFDGRLSAKADRMCGTVTYHGGRAFPMVAQKRPSTYQSQPQAQQAR
jgi:hypothetical protein